MTLRGCNTPDCRRLCQPDWAVCPQCALALLTPEVPARVRVARLSTTDPDFVPEWRRRSLARDMTEPVR